MTDITLEQRARELLAEACGADQSEIADALKFPNHPDNMVTVPDALRAIEAALRLSAGADWVLVPRAPTEAMCEAAGDGPIFIEGRMDGNTFIQSTHYDQRYLLDTWERMLAAAPRHEPGD